RRHTRSKRDWSSDVCSSDLALYLSAVRIAVLFSLYKFISYSTLSLKFSFTKNHNSLIVVYLSFRSKTDLCINKIKAVYYFIPFFLYFLYNPRNFSDYSDLKLFFLSDSIAIAAFCFSISSSLICWSSSSNLSLFPANNTPCFCDQTLPLTALTAVLTRSSMLSRR